MSRSERLPRNAIAMLWSASSDVTSQQNKRKLKNSGNKHKLDQFGYYIWIKKNSGNKQKLDKFGYYIWIKKNSGNKHKLEILQMQFFLIKRWNERFIFVYFLFVLTLYFKNIPHKIISVTLDWTLYFFTSPNYVN